MGDRSRHRICCVNCNICVNNFRRFRVLEMNSRVIALLSSWTYPLIITEDDLVCEACFDLAMSEVNRNLQLEVSSGIQEQAGRSQALSEIQEQAGPSQYGHTFVCLICGCSTARRQRDRILRENPTELQQSMIAIITTRVAPRQITESDHVCHACWLRTQREARRNTIVDQARSAVLLDQSTISASGEQQEDVPREITQREDVPREHTSIVLPEYRRAASCSTRCVFPNCTSTPLRSISDKLRATVLSNHKFYLPMRARVCDSHLRSNMWETLFESGNSIQTFTAAEIQHVFSFVNAFNKKLDFENIEEMEDHVFEYWIGLQKEKFNIILNEVPRLSNLKRGSLGLVALLLKMRTGDSDERIATLVQVPRRTLEGLMNKVRDILTEDFVRMNLGIESLSRDELIDHQLTIPKGLYGNENNAIVICDGTYVYIHKSANYSFQKKSYSLHKYRNLLKPFMIVACDGYIVDCFGPYKATTSDAEITNNLFREGSTLRSYFRRNDAFILDRGFRDSIEFLEGCGYKAHMPESLLEGEFQLTTEQANRSRCVTICRWVVEAVNGHFKRDFKLFRQEYFHRSLPHMMENFRIAAALLNRFGVRFQDNIYANEILEIIRQRINYVNNLSNMVGVINLNRRTSFFENINANAENISFFPTLEYRDLILFALGTYQIRQARSYYGEHVRSHGGCKIEVCSEGINPTQYGLRGSGETTLIRGRIKSRHISRKTYFVYILIENNIPGRTGILEYCCNCLVGRRTIGCCAHVMTLVWYLGWARHQPSFVAPAEFLDEIVIDDEEEE